MFNIFDLNKAHELPIDPNLNVKNVGKLSLPLSESQASELIKECSQATFGLKNKDLINKKVRDSYELDPSQIHFKHPEWQKQLDLLVKRVTKEMGCLDINITAKLHKILLYQKGSHFIRHRDSEKEKNMFAQASCNH